MPADVRKSFVRISFALAMLTLALALSAPTFAGQFSWVGPVALEPAQPDDVRPTTFHIAGTWPVIGGGPIKVRSVDVDTASREIVVDVAGGYCVVITCPRGPDYAVSADLGILPAGAWSLDVRVVAGEGDIFTQLERTISFTVAEGFELSTLDVQPTDLGPVRFHAEGPMPCPELSLASIADGVVRLEIATLEPCGIDVPGGTHEAGLDVDLGPGSYRVELRRGDGFSESLLAELDLEVVGVPIPLGSEGRYLASVTWTDFEGNRGIGLPAAPPSDDSALFWFFGPKNWELMLKVLGACDLNGHVWVFGAATTTVGYELRVVDTATGAEWTYENPLGQASEAITDIEAFVCD